MTVQKTANCNVCFEEVTPESPNVMILRVKTGGPVSPILELRSTDCFFDEGVAHICETCQEAVSGDA